MSISLTILITRQIRRKQNLKFAVTLTEVALLRGLHQWIKLYSMHDLYGQTAVAVFVVFFFPLENFCLTRLLLLSEKMLHRTFTDLTAIKV